MRIRHLIAAADVDGHGLIRAPANARHGVIVAGRISALAGPIDPLTHLNLDFAEHRLDECLVVETLAVGASVLRDDTGFVAAAAPRSAYQRLGPVDLDRRRVAWQAQFKRNE
jgi:hypothetical protein